LSEVRTWIIQQCNVYGSCTLRAVRFKQEFASNGADEAKEVAEFCEANGLTVTFMEEKGQYFFQKSG